MTTLLLASTGGHLKELVRLRPRLPISGDVVWVTNDTVQSRSLLEGEDVTFFPYQGSRNLKAALRNGAHAVTFLRARSVSTVVSTGSGIALSFLPTARLRGAACHYIESATRVHAPSLTGKVLSRVPGISCYFQHRSGALGRWRYGGSVLDGFVAVPKPEVQISKVVVSLGTWRQSFSGLIERLVSVLPPEAETLWQTGHTDVSHLPIEAVPFLPPTEMARAMAEADVVVTHAGMGTTLDALEAGRFPVVVPRRHHAGEQIDDHQVELAEQLQRCGLGRMCSASTLTREVLLEAAAHEVRSVAPLEPFDLAGLVGGRRR